MGNRPGTAIGVIMPTHSTIDELFEDLRRAGWQLGEKATGGQWNVSGTCGSITLHAEGLTREEAWRRAWEKAVAGAGVQATPGRGRLRIK
jgi:hypothetical protein